VHRIAKFRSDGTLAFVKGGYGTDSLHFNAPEGIAVRGALVYVADKGNDRISVWDTLGNHRTTIAGDFSRPQAIAVTDSGLLLITDQAAKGLKGINANGGTVFELKAEDETQLKDVVLSEDGRHVFTLKPSGNEVLKYRIKSDDSMPGGAMAQGQTSLPKVFVLSQPYPNPARATLNISYALPRASRVTVKLHDIVGKLQRTLKSETQKPGYYRLTWDRKDARGRTVAAGVYFCQVETGKERQQKKVVLTR
jgi:hypothetical protein